MKKYIYISSVALAFAIAAPVFSLAQSNQNGPGPGTPPLPPPPGMMGGASDSGQQNGQPNPPAGLSARLQSQYQTYMQNLQNNRDYRNTVIQGRYGSSTPPYMASGTPPLRRGFEGTTSPMMDGPGGMPPGMGYSSTTPPWHGNDGGGSTTTPRLGNMPPSFLRNLPQGMMPPLMRRFASSSPAFASSTLIQQLTAGHQHEQALRADAFAFLQGNLLQQLTQALNNLQQIQTRINTRIQTETAQGADMTAANADLATANADITAAQTAIQALSAFTPSSSSTDLTATTTVDLSQARQLGSTAIAAINIVRQDLNKAVQTIGQAAGAPPSSTSTPPVPPSNQ